MKLQLAYEEILTAFLKVTKHSAWFLGKNWRCPKQRVIEKRFKKERERFKKKKKGKCQSKGARELWQPGRPLD